MNKKIIYLLSLLMALSLAFAGCKKNGITDVKGDTNKETEVKNETGGLTKTWEDLKKYDTNAMNDYAVISQTGEDYYRNPVIVALGQGSVLIVTEKRIKYPGSANDIGVNGDKPVSIIYLLSKDGGDNFDAPKPIVADSQTKDDAVSAPVVYYKKDSGKVCVIASAGSGISRTGTDYANRNPKSKLKYSVGTVTGVDSESAIPTIDWSAWQDLDVSKVKLTTQFGTHSGRGIITDDNKLILPIITANQGTTVNIGSVREQMGVTFVKVTVNSDTLSIDDSAVIGAGFTFADGRTSGFSKYKEAKAVAYDKTADKVTYLAVPNPAGGDGKMGLGDSQQGQQAKDIAINAHEGSFGFHKFDKGWYGSKEYDPSKYGTDTAGSGEDIALFSHVQTRVGANHLYLLDPTTYTPKGGSFQLTKTSKSSSIDVLPDGTVIMAVEKELNEDNGLKFSIFFSRYTQSYLSSQLESK
ncbi:sialidase family protein [Brachyspira pilosicoli]|uniref:Exo-alpha-sialidase n=1 Tax=Brachyspira pilosicoli TaxID=52584 RepID=A0A5C8F824_BRAPL|nr:sialidase family protein [Brachyspira pilosicoli]TXJ46126.1 exo-alpha-sialidase [Brachyspira pilosicoli]